MMNVRRVKMEDLENLLPIFNQYRIFYKQESDLPGADAFLRQRIGNNESVIFIVENKKKAVTGFVQLYPLFSSIRMKKTWLLNDLFVHEDFRTLGVSKMLLIRAKQYCKETGGCELTLETQKDNFIANQLYHKANFKLDAEHNFYTWSDL